MKCDELKDRLFTAYPTDGICKAEVYGKKEVDEAIAELKADNERLKRALWRARAKRSMAEAYSVLNDVLTSNKWTKVLNKCQAKAQEY